MEGLIGETGIVAIPLAPEGKVSVHGEFWNATSDQPIEKGEKVQVIGVDSFKTESQKNRIRRNSYGHNRLSIGLVFFIVFIVILRASAIKILREYERGVIFRLGRLIGAKGPGIFFIIPGIDKMLRISLRTVTLDIPPQDVITRDNVSIKVNAVVYFRVLDPNQGGRRGRELPLCHVPIGPNDPSQRGGSDGTGRIACPQR